MDGADEGQAVSSFQIASMGESSSTTSVQLAHTQDQECGGHILQISCGLWVYNCTDMPLALQQGDLDVSQQQDPNEVQDKMLLLHSLLIFHMSSWRLVWQCQLLPSAMWIATARDLLVARCCVRSCFCGTSAAMLSITKDSRQWHDPRSQ